MSGADLAPRPGRHWPGTVFQRACTNVVAGCRGTSCNPFTILQGCGSQTHWWSQVQHGGEVHAPPGDGQRRRVQATCASGTETRTGWLQRSVILRDQLARLGDRRRYIPDCHQALRPGSSAVATRLWPRSHQSGMPSSCIHMIAEGVTDYYRFHGRATYGRRTKAGQTRDMTGA